jgi:uncharacterized membrane protein
MDFGLWIEFMVRWFHVLSGVMWIGLLWYFNFVQIPTVPKIPDELKPAIGKHIAPVALFWFRWAALSTVIWGAILGLMGVYSLHPLLLGFTGDLAQHEIMLGIGMWMGLIMAYNVWMVIWPAQKIALGLVDAPAEQKPAAARRAMLFSRTNTMLSIPMLYAMVQAQNVY